MRLAAGDGPDLPLAGDTPSWARTYASVLLAAILAGVTALLETIFATLSAQQWRRDLVRETINGVVEKLHALQLSEKTKQEEAKEKVLPPLPSP